LQHIICNLCTRCFKKKNCAHALCAPRDSHLNNAKANQTPNFPSGPSPFPQTPNLDHSACVCAYDFIMKCNSIKNNRTYDTTGCFPLNNKLINVKSLYYIPHPNVDAIIINLRFQWTSINNWEPTVWGIALNKMLYIFYYYLAASLVKHLPFNLKNSSRMK